MNASATPSSSARAALPSSPRDLRRLVEPRSIAVVGGAPREGSFGQRVLDNLSNSPGDVYAVNPKYEEVAGRACAPTLQALGHSVDCAVLVGNRETVEASL